MTFADVMKVTPGMQPVKVYKYSDPYNPIIKLMYSKTPISNSKTISAIMNKDVKMVTANKAPNADYSYLIVTVEG